MSLIERMTPDFRYSDDRGSLVQLVRRGFSQVNVVTSNAGEFRGGHYHKLNTEAYYIVDGKCIVTAKKEGKKETEIFSKGDFFRIGPYIIHDFDYIEDSILVTLYSLGVELNDYEKDMYDDSEFFGRKPAVIQ